MKKVIICLSLMFVFTSFVNAQKTMTGTVVDKIMTNHWVGYVIKVGNKKYTILTDQWPGASDMQRGVKGFSVKRSGKKLDEAKTLKVFYSKIDCSWNYTDQVNECTVWRPVKVVGVN